MAVKVATGSRGATPTRKGWHLVTFSNGSAALVRWTGSRWAWGSVKHPKASTIVGWWFIGATKNDVLATSGRFDQAIADAGLSAKTAAELFAEMDVGVTGLKGQPSLVTGSGKSETSVSGSEAVSAPIIPTPSISGLSIGSLFTNVGLWEGIGLCIGGGVLFILAARQLTG